MDAQARDNTGALRAAIAASARKRGSRLVLEPGVYRFEADRFGESQSLSVITGASDLTIDGSGATLLLATGTQPATLFRFSGGSNITIERLNIDCEALPFAQGRIASFDGVDTMTVQIDPQFPLQADLPIASIADYDPDTRAIVANIDIRTSAFESVERTGATVVIKLNRAVIARSPGQTGDFQELSKLLVDAPVLLRQKMYDGYAFSFVRCSNVTLRRVAILSYAGVGLHFQESQDIILQGLRIAPPKDRGRLMSTTKDAIHMSHVSGSVLMEDSELSGAGDDGINVYSKFRNIRAITGPTRIEIVFDHTRGWHGPTPRAGSVLRFWDAATLDEKSSTVVASGQWQAGSRSFSVELKEPNPSLQNGDWVSNDDFLARVVVRRCRIHGMLGRAAVFSTHDVLVEDCHMSATAYNGILLPAGSRHERQGPAARKVIIRRNIFEDTGAAAVYGYVFTARPGTTALSGITIEDNVIRSSPATGRRRIRDRHPEWLHWSSGICITDASQVRIARNEFAGFQPAIYLGNVDGVHIEGNSIPDGSEVRLYAARNVEASLRHGTSVSRLRDRPDSDLHYMTLLRR